MILLALTVGLIIPTAAAAEDRKVKNQVQPIYPELAKTMHLAGTVKVEITINQQGAVTNAKVIGGHPVLADSAVKAVQKWRYETGSEETRIISFDFKPN